MLTAANPVEWCDAVWDILTLLKMTHIRLGVATRSRGIDERTHSPAAGVEAREHAAGAGMYRHPHPLPPVATSQARQLLPARRHTDLLRRAARAGHFRCDFS